MAYFLVQDDVVVGRSDFNSAPAGYTIHQGPDVPPDCIYFDGVSIVERPTQPSSDHRWSKRDRQWVLPTPEVLLPSGPDWKGLEAALRGSVFFAKAWVAAGESTRCNRSLTQLQVAISGSRNVPDFAFAINAARADIKELADAGTVPGFLDFTQSEIEQLESVLGAVGFDVSLFTLEV